jgi:hypothetical protein
MLGKMLAGRIAKGSASRPTDNGRKRYLPVGLSGLAGWLLCAIPKKVTKIKWLWQDDIVDIGSASRTV